MNTAAIAAWQAGPAVPVRLFPTLPSTSGYAKDYAGHHHVTALHAFLAERQTAGYGKRGRSFFSPADSGIYLSLLVPAAAVTPLAPGLLTTGAAVTVVNVLQRFFPMTVFHVKWVNDIVVDHKKVAGILVEETAGGVVIGIGLNLFTAQFPTELQVKAGAVTGRAVDRNIVVAGLLDALAAFVPAYHTGGFLPEYRALASMIGQSVTVAVGNQTLRGTATAIDALGALVLTLADGSQRVLTAGEVTRVILPVSLYEGGAAV